jgi:hypothetical protein
MGLHGGVCACAQGLVVYRAMCNKERASCGAVKTRVEREQSPRQTRCQGSMYVPGTADGDGDPLHLTSQEQLGTS